jgi:hypothetical protein
MPAIKRSIILVLAVLLLPTVAAAQFFGSKPEGPGGLPGGLPGHGPGIDYDKSIMGAPSMSAPAIPELGYPDAAPAAPVTEPPAAEEGTACDCYEIDEVPIRDKRGRIVRTETKRVVKGRSAECCSR